MTSLDWLLYASAYFWALLIALLVVGLLFIVPKNKIENKEDDQKTNHKEP